MSFPPQGQLCPPDLVSLDKAHGRLERRELWARDAADLGRYLEREYRWPGVRQAGLIRRWRRRPTSAGWEQVETHPWLSSLAPELAGAAVLAAGLRGHWAIENGLHYVRDVTYAEDRLHARVTAHLLAAIRNAALNLLRPLGFAFIPDARRSLAASPQLGLPLLAGPSEH